MKRYKTSARRRELVRASLRKRRERLIADGICRDCGKLQAKRGCTLCQACISYRDHNPRESVEWVERMLELAAMT